MTAFHQVLLRGSHWDRCFLLWAAIYCAFNEAWLAVCPVAHYHQQDVLVLIRSAIIAIIVPGIHRVQISNHSAGGMPPVSATSEGTHTMTEWQVFCWAILGFFLLSTVWFGLPHNCLDSVLPVTSFIPVLCFSSVSHMLLINLSLFFHSTTYRRTALLPLSAFPSTPLPTSQSSHRPPRCKFLTFGHLSPCGMHKWRPIITLVVSSKSCILSCAASVAADKRGAWLGWRKAIDSYWQAFQSPLMKGMSQCLITEHHERTALSSSPIGIH